MDEHFCLRLLAEFASEEYRSDATTAGDSGSASSMQELWQEVLQLRSELTKARRSGKRVSTTIHA